MKTFNFAHFRQSRRRGVVIVTFAIGAFMLCGFAGLALDVAYLQMWKRKAQTAADAAAQAAAIELKRTQSSTAANNAAFADAAANGFVHNAGSVVTVENPPQSGIHAGDTKFAQVFVRKPMGTYFMRAFGRDAVNVAAVANSGLSQMDACIFVMEPSGNNAMQIAGSPQVQMSCGIQVNSTSNSALQVTGGAIINTLSYNVTGGTQISTGAVITPMPVTGMPAEDDPLAWRAQPPVGSSCDYNNFKVTSGNGNNNNPIKMNPGVYCGGVDISADRPIEMAAGLYVMAGGGFKVSSQSTLTGTGVTIYNTQSFHRNRGAISITGGVTVDLQAPRTGTYEAMLIWDDRKIFDNGPNHIEGTAASDIEGIIYMPNSILNFAGGSSTTANYTGLVSRTLAVTGHSTLKANYAVLTNGAPLLRAVLVQ
ncbi:MAG: hypothetical protein IT162_07190 [Bryobacterales bacterium]|nr:hypothetical protein [Bryobacterales bacterium]